MCKATRGLSSLRRRRPDQGAPGQPRRLLDKRIVTIDPVMFCKSTHRLFHTPGKGEQIDGRRARETLRITHATAAKLSDTAFRYAAVVYGAIRPRSRPLASARPMSFMPLPDLAPE